MTGWKRPLGKKWATMLPAIGMMGLMTATLLGGCALEQEKKQQSQFDSLVHDRIVHYLVQEDDTPLRREGLTEKQAHGAMWAMFNQGTSQCAAMGRKLMADAVMLELSHDYQSLEDVPAMRKRMEHEHLCDEGHVR